MKELIAQEMDYISFLLNPSYLFHLFHRSLHATKPLFQYASLEMPPWGRSSEGVKVTSCVLDRPFDAAPVELVRYILELAATNDTSTAYSISLLSHCVHAWIDPILYACITLRSPTSFAAALHSKSAEFLSTHVKFLRLEHADVLQPWNPHPHLRPEYISVGGMLPYVAFQYDMPMLATVKRLHFSDDVPIYLLSQMPQLTHFSCCYRHRPFSQSLSQTQYPGLPILRHILSLPRLQLVVIHVYKEKGVYSKEKMESAMEGILEVSDPRVVVASGGPGAAEKWGPVDDYRWYLAEEAVQNGSKYVEAQ